MGKDKSGKLDTMIGVNDKELKTPEHDKMCLWVDKNYTEILNKSKIMELINNYCFNLYFSYSSYGGNCSREKYDKAFKGTNLKLLWEEPIKGNNGFIIGIPDFKIDFYNVHHEIQRNLKNTYLYFEIKPKIISIGKTMRQLKLYKSFIPKYDEDRHETLSIIFLITNSSNNIDIFEKQGIKTFIISDEMLKTIQL